MTTGDVANSLVAGTSSSRYTLANYWADPMSGIGYQVQVEIPERQMNSLEGVKNLPGEMAGGNLAEICRYVAALLPVACAGEYHVKIRRPEGAPSYFVFGQPDYDERRFDLYGRVHVYRAPRRNTFNELFSRSGLNGLGQATLQRPRPCPPVSIRVKEEARRGATEPKG